MTIRETAEALNLSTQRVHQLLSSGQLAGVDLPPGRMRHSPGSGRVHRASVEEWLSNSHRHKILRPGGEPVGIQGSAVGAGAAANLSRGVLREDSDAHANEVQAARAAALEMKVLLDASRDQVRVERSRTRRALSVAAELLDLLRDATADADSLDELADGYSAALTQLLAPGMPPSER